VYDLARLINLAPVAVHDLVIPCVNRARSDLVYRSLGGFAAGVPPRASVLFKVFSSSRTTTCTPRLQTSTNRPVWSLKRYASDWVVRFATSAVKLRELGQCLCGVRRHRKKLPQGLQHAPHSAFRLDHLETCPISLF
jgi:hypothetical protein